MRKWLLPEYSLYYVSNAEGKGRKEEERKKEGKKKRKRGRKTGRKEGGNNESEDNNNNPILETIPKNNQLINL